MRLALLCPFTAGAVLWQPQNGGFTLSVCVRGTFSLVHGREAVLADVQEPVVADRHHGDDPRASLYAAADVVPYKPRADVVLVGSAYAPGQDAVEALVARLKIGALDKSLGVIGDRAWIEGPDGPEPSAPRPFRSMPLRYERAARARDNPHGFDLTSPPVTGALALPNLEAADDEIGGGRTVGFGPIARIAPARRALLRPDGWTWAEGGARGQAPMGFDFAFYNSAPRDQQLESLTSGQVLLLENLNREHARLETRLPTVRPKAFLVPGEVDRGLEISLRCDTLWIDTDRAILTLTWRGYAPVSSADEDAIGAVVVAVEAQGREIGYAQIAKILRDGISVSTDGDTFGEARPLGARVGSVPEDPDLLPTPGPFKARAPLPDMPPIVIPEDRPRQPAASATDVSPPSITLTTTSSILPQPLIAPVVIEAEETAAPVSWEEISNVEYVDNLLGEEAQTINRMEAFVDEPSTRPVLQRPQPRGEMSAADYARIAVAVERGNAAETLFRYGLALPDLPRVQQTWTDRAASDPAFARDFAAAIVVARQI